MNTERLPTTERLLAQGLYNTRILSKIRRIVQLCLVYSDLENEVTYLYCGCGCGVFIHCLVYYHHVQSLGAPTLPCNMYCSRTDYTSGCSRLSLVPLSSL